MKCGVTAFVCGLAVTSGVVFGQSSAPASHKEQPAKKTEHTSAPKDAPKDASKEAAKVTLKVGDQAPALVVSDWVKGEAVKSFEKGKVYVVEFWATWCGPCVANIPHLTELQHKYKDAVIMGIAASEHREKSGDGRLEKLKDFVVKQESKLDYRIGFDPDRKMGDPWMVAAGKDSIPTAFIVSHEGKIAWIGSPADLEDHLAAAVKAAGKNSKKESAKAEKKKTEKSKK